jgi:hypothetical protein
VRKPAEIQADAEMVTIEMFANLAMVNTPGMEQELARLYNRHQARDKAVWDKMRINSMFEDGPWYQIEQMQTFKYY